MAVIQIREGKINKVVRVRFAARKSGSETNLDNCDGYGILLGADNREIFFVDTALQDACFSDLRPGHRALYVLEAGPLARAAKVWVATSRTTIQEQAAESNGIRGRIHTGWRRWGS
jgi:hypothetical protein